MQGDSGGPVIIASGFLVGVISEATKGCPIGGLNTFASTFAYQDFINHYTR